MWKSTRDSEVSTTSLLLDASVSGTSPTALPPYSTIPAIIKIVLYTLLTVIKLSFKFTGLDLKIFRRWIKYLIF